VTRRTLHVLPGVEFCVDNVGGNPDGSFQAVNATVGACGVTPPPPPGVDTSAIATAQVIYGTDDPHQIANNVDMRQLANIFGRGNAAQEIVGYGYRSGTAVQFIIPPNKHLRAAIDVPADCPNGSRVLKAVSYALPGHSLPSGWQQHSIKAAVVPRGADWSAATDPGSHVSGVIFADHTILTFAVGQPPSTAKAELQRSSGYDLLLGFDDAAYGGGVVLQWN
jgi:hypothetical protein